MTDNGLYYALSTIAQCAAALAALIGFLGLWRLDRLREEQHQDDRDLRGLLKNAGVSPEQAAFMATEDLIEEARTVATTMTEQGAVNTSALPDTRVRRRQERVNEILRRWDARQGQQKWLRGALRVFLGVTLVVILAPAVVSLLYVNVLLTWVWTPWLIGAASAWLAVAPVYVMLQAFGRAEPGGVRLRALEPP